ncbi:MAG: hypothetical protein WA790_19170 [Sulfitobacter sp.]
MPNWVFNEVDVHASIDEVLVFLATDYDMDDPNRPVSRFNLHKLFPERFDIDDLCGQKNWNYDWMVENTGAKWNVTISARSESDGVTSLCFDSAWSPTNGLLERMHELTGWTIHNEFEEEQPEYEGSFHCEG